MDKDVLTKMLKANINTFDPARCYSFNAKLLTNQFGFSHRQEIGENYFPLSFERMERESDHLTIYNRVFSGFLVTRTGNVGPGYQGACFDKSFCLEPSELPYLTENRDVVLDLDVKLPTGEYLLTDSYELRLLERPCLIGYDYNKSDILRWKTKFTIVDNYRIYRGETNE